MTGYKIMSISGPQTYPHGYRAEDGFHHYYTSKELAEDKLRRLLEENCTENYALLEGTPSGESYMSPSLVEGCCRQFTTENILYIV